MKQDENEDKNIDDDKSLDNENIYNSDHIKNNNSNNFLDNINLEEFVKGTTSGDYSNVEEYLSTLPNADMLSKQLRDALNNGDEFIKKIIENTKQKIENDKKEEQEDIDEKSSDITSVFEKISGDLQDFFEEKYKNGEYEGMEMPQFGVFDVSAYQSPDLGFLNKDSSMGKTKQKIKPPKKKKLLDVYGENLTKKALLGQLDKVIGRENEIRRTIEILNRRTKNNPCLIGEPRCSAKQQ